MCIFKNHNILRLFITDHNYRVLRKKTACAIQDFLTFKLDTQLFFLSLLRCSYTTDVSNEVLINNTQYIHVHKQEINVWKYTNLYASWNLVHIKRPMKRSVHFAGVAWRHDAALVSVERSWSINVAISNGLERMWMSHQN